MLANYKSFIQEGNSIFSEVDKRRTHLNQRYSLVDQELTQKLITDLKNLSSKLPVIKNPQNLEEVLVSELKRSCDGGVLVLNEDLSQNIAIPENILSKYNVRKDDIDLIKDWLLSNKANILQANKRQFDYHSKHRTIGVPMGSPELRTSAEDLVAKNISLMKEILHKYFQDFKGIKLLLDTYIITLDSNEKRSFASRVGKVAVICIEPITSLYNGKIELIPERFIRIFGHEVIGHCLNYVLTENSELPFFIKEGFPSLTMAAAESMTNYWEDKLFHDLVSNSQIKELLSHDESFEEVYNRYQDVKILSEYAKKLEMLGLWTLATSKAGDVKDQIESLQKYSLNPSWPSYFVNSYRNNWNRETGFLLPRYVSELRYSVDPVGKVLKHVSKKNLKRFEELISTGFWTPDGLTEWVKVGLS